MRRQFPHFLEKRTITPIVPFSAGGPSTFWLPASRPVSRTIGNGRALSKQTGGAGNIGIEVVRDATPDGTKLLLIPAGNLHDQPDPDARIQKSFNVERDFVPVSLPASAANILVVSLKLGVTSIRRQLIEKGRRRRVMAHPESAASCIWLKWSRPAGMTAPTSSTFPIAPATSA